MSSMPGNPHREAANKLLQEAQASGGSYLDPNTEGLMLAAAEATLALAYEQRTANLLKALELQHRAGARLGVTDQDIAARLGLKADA